jgi:hypothetical protein
LSTGLRPLFRLALGGVPHDRPMEAWARIRELAGEQYGMLSRRQAESAGLDASTVSRALERHGWERRHRGVYAPPGAFATPEGRAAAALLAIGPPVLLADWTAAWLWGLVRTPPTVPQLVVPARRGVTTLEGIAARRSGTLVVEEDGAVVHGLLVTSPARTLCDLSALTTEDTLRALLIDARQRRLVELADVLQRAAGMGTAKGLRQMRRLVCELDRARCDSVLEHRLRGRLGDVPELPPPASGPVPVDVGGRTLHVDIGWPEERVGIEVDGFGSHSERRSLEIDQRRHNALQLARWRVLRAGWREAGDGFPDLLRDLRGLFSA